MQVQNCALDKCQAFLEVPLLKSPGKAICDKYFIPPLLVLICHVIKYTSQAVGCSVPGHGKGMVESADAVECLLQQDEAFLFQK